MQRCRPLIAPTPSFRHSAAPPPPSSPPRSTRPAAATFSSLSRLLARRWTPLHSSHRPPPPRRALPFRPDHCTYAPPVTPFLQRPSLSSAALMMFGLIFLSFLFVSTRVLSFAQRRACPQPSPLWTRSCLAAGCTDATFASCSSVDVFSSRYTLTRVLHSLPSSATASARVGFRARIGTRSNFQKLAVVAGN